ncbi:hypothetical protein GVX81_08135 [[Haemophilus] felis]|uniref:Cation efflux protein transmembrane domain-containing protein n=1 Tax=[Haemophilus] felis TaxID=123822 RepID=A0A1T0BBN2_9PAST|nr:hypothetical protein [[Haemophilus] felis]NBI41170.1 hypothetical protein [[Haemophilus] felis]NBI42807.1 hypothetical protein [[Haemophilus] felis]OOS07527.1 hypothetical protein B0188_00145 [[Haemophilus] felis]
MSNLYSQQVKNAAHFAILTALILILVKGFAWWRTDSMAMLASIADSVLDLFSALMSMWIL